MNTHLQFFRSQFPHLQRDELYLDHAAVAPLAMSVRDQLERYLDEVQKKRINNFESTFEIMNTLRENVARLVHATPDRIAFTRNTTDGMVLLARGFPWQNGDRIMVHRMEFPSNVYPWVDLKPLGVNVDFLDTQAGRVTPDDLEPLMTDRTRLLAVSWVQYFSGYRNDLAELAEWCHHHGLRLAVDGMQGLGALDLNVIETGIDFLATGSAKWLLGPQGTGFIYLTRELQNKLHPPHLGWWSRKDFFDFHHYDQPLKPDANRFEFATPYSLGLWGLEAAIELLLDAGQPDIERRVLALTDKLADGLTRRGWTLLSNRDTEELKSGIVTVTHPERSRNQKIYQFLRKQNITVSLRNGCLRISPHFYNTMEEIEHCVDVLNEAF